MKENHLEELHVSSRLWYKPQKVFYQFLVGIYEKHPLTENHLGSAFADYNLSVTFYNNIHIKY